MNPPLWESSLVSGDRDRLKQWVAGKEPLRMACAGSGARAFLAWAMAAASRGPWVWVLEGGKALDLFYDDLSATGNRERVALWPAREEASLSGPPDNPVLAGERLRALWRLISGPPPGIICTCVHALLQRVTAPRVLREAMVPVRRGSAFAPGDLAAALEARGYRFEAKVGAPGDAALRGGLLDLWPLTEEAPLRLEFFGNTIDSIRAFDPVTQLSIGKKEEAMLSPAGEPSPDAVFTDYLPKGVHWVWVHPSRLSLQAARAAEAGGEAVLALDTLREHLAARQPSAALEIIAPGVPGAQWDPLMPAERAPDLSSGATAPDLAASLRERLIEQSLKRGREDWEVHFFFDTSGAKDHFAHTHPEWNKGHTALHAAPLSAGFIYPARRLEVITESDLYGFRRVRRPRSAPARERATLVSLQRAWSALEPGDLVVHADHGLGRYLGLQDIRMDGRPQEVMAVEYDGGAKLLVPVRQAHLVSRYIGSGGEHPPLHRLGGRLWVRQKDAAREAVRELAVTLLDTLAAREVLAGHAFPPDTPWQREFEAAFPYQETPDQARAVAAVKADMESARPMDRLVCGDVGYGKTEVALRAAFKAVMDHRQVALLTPTTVLAQQHFDTFRARMAAFPVRVEMLSRFLSRAEQRALVLDIRAGRVDIVIGTHRLIQPDVAFHNLGLVVIDEEQRFGVVHKEALKKLRRLVDVLTLTATPIPRTLYLSLTGAKDMSTIQTAPLERLPVETRLVAYSDALVREAILREINREGQVFYLHNRVCTIEEAGRRLKRIVPEARLAIAHGRMPENELAGIMRRFITGAYDVLLCTTIIESGVDIPNVNTILVDRADRFGLADLYQLRGRVGRTNRRAYAFFLLPPRGRIPEAARRRLGVMQRHGRLGEGFTVALRDLEIRGAGNLLGARQSGHIAAVGFEMYCRLLRAAIARHDGEAPPPVMEVELRLPFMETSPSRAEAPGSATLPYSYIEDEPQRIEAYRELASATEEELDTLAGTWRDRYGPLPAAAERLLLLSRIRAAAARRGISLVEVRDDKLMLTRNGDYVMRARRFPRLRASDPSGRLEEMLRLLHTWDALRDPCT